MGVGTLQNTFRGGYRQCDSCDFTRSNCLIYIKSEQTRGKLELSHSRYWHCICIWRMSWVWVTKRNNFHPLNKCTRELNSLYRPNTLANKKHGSQCAWTLAGGSRETRRAN